MKRLLTLMIVMACIVAMSSSLPATQNDHDEPMKKDEPADSNVKSNAMAETFQGHDDTLKYHQTNDNDKLHKRDTMEPIEPVKPKDDDNTESKGTLKPLPQVEDLSDIVYGDKPNSTLKSVS